MVLNAGWHIAGDALERAKAWDGAQPLLRMEMSAIVTIRNNRDY